MALEKPAIEIKGLYKIYGASPESALDRIRTGPASATEAGVFVALKNINLTVEAGKICVIMGLSGSGKSTLLRCINRLIDPTAGEIVIRGREITKANKKELRNIRASTIGMVFQHFALLPHMSVIDNVAFGLRIAGVPRKVRRERAANALQLVGLSGWDDRKPSSLSGGMRQRVGLARALVMDTPILLMDEPFSALDPLIREEMQQELLRLQSTLRKTIVFVTHDPNEAATLGDYIAILLKGEIVQEGHPLDAVLSPANDYVRNFVRGINVFKVLTAGQLIDAARPPVVLNGSTISSLAMIRPPSGPVAVTNGGGQLLGIIERPSDLGSSQAEWEKHLSQDFIRLTSGTLIAPYLDELSRNQRPLVVAEDDGTFIGMITASSVLKALASNRSVVGTQTRPDIEVQPDQLPTGADQRRAV
jgi:glycine betaine/proline transport system ATP-binding protein